MLPTAAATPGGGRRSRAVDGGAIIEAVVELMRETLSELLAPAAVEAALRKAQKGAAMKALLSRAKGAPKGPKTPGKLRSAYTAFVQECFHALKEANIQSDLQTVAGLWKLLPAHVISDVQGRFNAIKCVGQPLCASCCSPLPSPRPRPWQHSPSLTVLVRHLSSPRHTLIQPLPASSQRGETSCHPSSLFPVLSPLVLPPF